jgi:hypothetical protein
VKLLWNQLNNRLTKKMKRNFIGYVVRAVLHRWLEYKNAMALRARPAGLIKFATAVCNGAEAKGMREH